MLRGIGKGKTEAIQEGRAKNLEVAENLLGHNERKLMRKIVDKEEQTDGE